MKRTLRVLPEAEAELQSGATWYEEKRPGLGIEFVAVLDRAFESILENPEACPVWRADRPYRKRVLKRFPYILFFGTDAATIEIVAVAHAKRRPGYWLDRRGEEAQAIESSPMREDSFVDLVDSPDGPFTLMLESDARVAYAYLLEGGKIVADVWLYNVAPTPPATNWEDPTQMPFLNPAPFAARRSSYDIRHGVTCRWHGGTVEVFSGGTRVAVLAPDAKPGWSLNAAATGPLARPLADAPG